jgi:hypothetical protein
MAMAPLPIDGPYFACVLQALDTFNTAMVSSIYYVLFTVCTITASTIMYKDWKNQTVTLVGREVQELRVLLPLQPSFANRFLQFGTKHLVSSS